ncbi:MAG: dicarboxylate/amino acid:cation symporter [Saprospiraceae bacterium]|nr:dicarboxylate/amino acid:cation symporter [Saprospiraceae bacterium]
MRKLELHWQILIGMILGVVAGLLFSRLGLEGFVKDWIKPFGTIFINLLKLIAIPLILVSLIKGISDLHDISKFRIMGIRTFAMYVFTTVLAVSVGLVIVNIIQPGSYVSPGTVAEISETYGTSVQSKIQSAETVRQGPLQFLVDMVPDNIVGAASNNGNMLKVIFFSVFFGISLLLVDKNLAKPVNDFFTGLNEVIMKMVDLIMLGAPYAVFALLCALITETTNPDLFVALLWYVLAVISGLLIMLILYSLFLYFYASKSPAEFFRAMAPAQLLAFSTSSSAATLPVTMERVEEHLGVEKEVTSFVCPLGATINMDGTSLYQAVAAVFICEAMLFDLSFSDQLTIILTATLASIGSAAVPGAGLIMLVIVLESVGLPADKMAIGLALIFAVDRPLDMMRTVINVTGDGMVAYIVGKSLGKVGPPKVKNWDDNYHPENAG